MDVRFHDKIQLQVIILYHARDVAALDFKTHKSLEHLDLNAYENRFHRTTVFTSEDIRKRIQPHRQVLYKYHIDLPSNSDFICSTDRIDIVSENAFHLRQIYVCDSVYGHGLEIPIVEAIKSHRGNKTEKLRSYMKIFKLLNFCQYFEATVHIYSNLLPVLYFENCTDSKLVMDFVSSFNFCWWLFNRENPNVLQYVLQHSQRIQYTSDLWENLKPETDPVITCFLQHRITNVRILLMYGVPMVIPAEFNFSHYIDISDRIFHEAIQRGIASFRRGFLIFLLLYDFQHHRESPQGLQCIWKSIKDPFLSHQELFFTLSPVVPKETMIQVHHYFAKFVSGGSCVFRPYPRKLKHLCRVDIRKLLYSHHQLPSEIPHLAIPETLKPYLYEY